jgi:nitroimidazol reductase NimA-like FMN-containing flavoprotein (pyridoxamine 5'-phosphate oxidase superfamily)
VAGKRKLNVRMTDDEAWAMLRDAHTGIFTSLRSDGVPIALPLWFAAIDGAIYFNTRGKKLIRVRNDPRSSFLVEAGARWVDLNAVHLTGRAEIIELDPDLRAAFGAEIKRKYARFRGVSVMPEESKRHYETARGGVVRFTPDARILTWDNRKLPAQA